MFKSEKAYMSRNIVGTEEDKGIIIVERPKEYWDDCYPTGIYEQYDYKRHDLGKKIERQLKGI